MGKPYTFQAMNTDFLVDGVSDSAAASVQSKVKLAESTFSRFAPDSEISRVNQMAGEWVAVSPLAYDLLSDAVDAFRATEGLFNPFMGRTLQILGYARSFELLHPMTSPPDIAGWRERVEGIKRQASESLPGDRVPLEMDPNKQKVRLLTELALDVGGIAKGWTAQRTADGLMAQGVKSGLVDAGGDVVLWGREPKQGLWGIGVADPMRAGEDIADLWFEGLTAMATSSVVKRSWRVPGGGSAHHIIDSRTGVSSESDVLQVTVITRDLSVAEQYAKCLIVLGSEDGFPWIAKRRPDLAYISVLRSGLIHVSNNIDSYAKEWEVKKHVKWTES